MRTCWLISFILTLGLAGCSGKKTPAPEPAPDATPTSAAEAPKPTAPSKTKDELVQNGKHLTLWIKDLESDDPDVRLRAESTLRDQYRSKAKGAAPALTKLLKDKYDPIRAAAAQALAELGPDAKEAVPALIDVFQNDKLEKVRLVAAEALMRLGVEAKPALPAFIKALDDSEQRIRVASVNVLAAVDPQDKDVQAAFIKALRDRDPTVANEAIRALVEQVGEPAVPALTDTVKGSDVKAAEHATRALGRFGAKAKPAVPTLSQVLRITPRENKELRVYIAEVLGTIGPDAKEAVPNLIDSLPDDDYKVRMAASTALIRIGPDADAVPKLAAILKNEEGNGRFEAARVLVKIGKPAVSPLVEALSSINSDVLETAISALEAIGPDAKPAVLKLSFLLKDGDEKIKKAAAKALKKIDPEEAARLGA